MTNEFDFSTGSAERRAPKTAITDAAREVKTSRRPELPGKRCRTVLLAVAMSTAALSASAQQVTMDYTSSGGDMTVNVSAKFAAPGEAVFCEGGTFGGISGIQNTVGNSLSFASVGTPASPTTCIALSFADGTQETGLSTATGGLNTPGSTYSAPNCVYSGPETVNIVTSTGRRVRAVSSDGTTALTGTLACTWDGDLNVAPTITAPANIAAVVPNGVTTSSQAFSATVTDTADDIADTPTTTFTNAAGGATLTSPFDFPVGVTTVNIDAEDDAGLSAIQQSFTVTITENSLPVADAGSDQPSVATGATVNLDGSGSSDPDAGDTIASYLWSQTTGPTVSLTGQTTATPSFTAPTLNVGDAPVDLIFQLFVTDAPIGDSSVADTVTITVQPPANTAPTANAGPDQPGIASAATVTLDGSGSSDPDAGDAIATYAWTQTAGTAVTLSDPAVAGPTFTAPTLLVSDAAEVLTFSLIVTDNNGGTSVADTVDVTVNPPGNVAPTADAGPDQPGIASAATVTLDGSGSSDPDAGDAIATYAWTQTAGTAVTLSDPAVAGPTFTAPTLLVSDAAEVLTFSLIVTDNNGGTSVADTVDVTVNPPGNVAPTANAGPDQPGIASAATVTLDGSGSSDPDAGDAIATYAWTQTAGTAVTLSDPAVAGPTFTAPTLLVSDAAEVLTFSLIVTDNNGGTSVADTVDVTVNPPGNVAPTANAGPDQPGIASAATVTLDGSGSSDPDAGDAIATYAWTQTAGTAVTLSDPAVAGPTFTAPTLLVSDAAEVLTFSLIVTDNNGGTSVADTVDVTVNPPGNVAPTANAGPDQPGIASAATVTLDGSGSSDPDAGDAIATYAWTQTAGTAVTLSDPAVAGPTFTAPMLGFGASEALTFSLIVTDNNGGTSVADTVTVTIVGAANPTITAITPDGTGILTVTGTAEPGSMVTVTFPDGSTGTAVADDPSGDYSIVSMVGQSSGTVSVVAMIGGESSTPVTQAYTDAVPPAPPVFGTPTVGSEGELTVTGTAEPGSTVVVTFPDGSTGTVVASDPGGEFTLTSGPNQPSGDVSVVATDEAGNPSTPATQAYTDETPPAPPTIDAPIIGVDGELTVTGTAEPGSNVLVTFPDGSTTTVVASDPGGIYTATSGPDQPNGDITAIATDADGNMSALVTRAFVGATASIEETQREIATFMYERANRLVQHQPELIGLLSDNGTGSFNANATRSSGTLQFASDPNNRVWIDVSASWGTTGENDTQYVFGAVGSHVAMSENLLIGGMVELDYLDQSSDTSSVTGSGWLVGPYVVSKLPSQPIFFEGRALYGQTSNEVSPLGTYTDEFDTERWLVQAKVVGQYELGTSTVTPNLSLSHTSDTQEEYVDTGSVTIPEQDIELSEVSLGADFATPVPVESGALELTGGLNGVWSSTSGGGNASTVVPEFDGERAKVDFGLNYIAEGGMQTNANVFYDGIGTDDYESYGFEVQLILNF